MRALGALVDEVTSIVRGADETSVKRALNRAYRRVVRAGDWPDLREEASFSGTDSDGFLVFPEYVDKIYAVLSSTNFLIPQRDLKRQTTSTYGTSGSGYRWAYAGWQPVYVQPSAADEITIYTDAGGNVTCDIRVSGLSNPAEGTDTGAIRKVETLSYSGEQTKDTSAAFISLISVSTETENAVDMVIKTKDTAEFLGMLLAGHQASRYRRIRIWYKEGSASSFTVEYQRFARTLVHDDDGPILPCSDVMVALAAAEILMRHKRGTQAQFYEAQGARQLQELLMEQDNLSRGARRAVPNRGYGRRYH